MDIHAIHSASAAPERFYNAHTPAVNTRARNDNFASNFEALVALSGNRQPARAATAANDSTLVSLTPQTLNLLSGVDKNIATGTATDLTLSPLQEQQVAAIMGDFVNAPLNAQTFRAIQSQLVAAGISPAQLSVENLLLAFNPALASVYPQAVDRRSSLVAQNFNRSAKA